MADVIIPNVVELFEGGGNIASTSYNFGEIYSVRFQLIKNMGLPIDITSETLTFGIYNSAGTLETAAGSIAKEINELGILKLSGFSWGAAGTKNLYIIATNGAVVRKFGPYKVEVVPL